MTKGNFHAIFDQSTYEQFQIIVGKGNVCKSFENFMLNTVASHNKDLTHINIILVNKKIDELNQKMSKIKAELDDNLRMKEIYEQNKVKEETNQLEAEAKRIEEAKTCLNCKNVIQGKNIIVAKGNLCKSCFMSLPFDKMKEYTKTD